MSGQSWPILVANPSPYTRSDYVEVDLKAIGVDAALDEQQLILHRIAPEDGRRQEVPFQIDYPLGKSHEQNRVLTFLATNAPPRHDEYLETSLQFVLEKGTPANLVPKSQEDLLWVGHYHDDRRPDEPKDGFNKRWDRDRSVKGVKLSNGRLESHFSLAAHPRQHTAIDYSGSFTSVRFADAEEETGAGEMLAPYQNAPEKRWGQIEGLEFFPLPWDHSRPAFISLSENRYELVWSNSGATRATVTVRSAPFTVRYPSSGYSRPDGMELTCRFHRVFSVYPEKPFLTEDVFVLTDTGRSVCFRPHYYANLCYPAGVQTKLKRFEHIPDYLAIWKHFATEFRGLAYASDSHVRHVREENGEARWRLQLGHVQRCVHYFMFHGYPETAKDIDMFHEAGHYAWYERVFKPLRVHPLRDFSAVRQYNYG